MKLRASIAVALLAGGSLLAAGTVVAAEKSDKNKVSEKVAKIMKPAQDSYNAKKYNDALTKVHEAESIPDKTPFDQFTIAEFGCAAGVGAQNYAEAAKYCEAKLNSSFMPEAEVPSLVRNLISLNYATKNYDKAIEFAQRAVKAGYASEDNKNLLAQAYYLKNDWKDTFRIEDQLVDQEIKAGQTPKEQQLSLLLSACVKMEDNGCQQHALERMVSYYPKPEHWEALLFSVRQAVTGNDAVTLQTYRLMNDVDVLKNPQDYNEMANLAIEAGSPGEAQKVLQKGFDKNVFTDPNIKARNQRLLETARKNAANDQATLAKTEREADAAQTGAKNFGVGVAYLGYGQYDKAVDAMQKGITKGGLRNDAEAHLMLGIAQLKAGRKDDAVKSFKSVKGDPQLEKLANLWVLHARQA
ncbi:MAG: tetratricopeptide repeat protein [Gammaproteobacteria bacterium]|nr:tetratricopeptide repeat protein [Gammaproteobacteria bacterium]MBV9622161.1 tetratricopeptide repeat protein [Gammaproteobacteria bacterium]